ncbi:MAG: RluA family pseudouridine synthase [Firmicutes bacterium]|nr:RluA family pseudouridine synthase [Bacillota bacterium]
MKRLNENLEYTILETDPLIRIDKFLSELYEELSRTTVQKMIALQTVLVNSKAVKANYKVKIGDFIQLEEIPLTEQDIQAENIPLDIVYEDDYLLVVNKPSGMVTHPAPGHYEHTLVNALLYHINQLSNINGDIRPGIVHRIDKDTSGLLMVAKTDYAHQVLADELKEKTTKREYIALVDGVILNQRGTIDAPLARDPRDRKKMAVVASGKSAVTHFEVLKRFSDKTLVSCQLETGRTHQIRVHFAYIKFPLVGDYVYGKNKNATEFGQFLHAKTIGFTHPITKKWMEFTRELPQEFSDLIESLQSGIAS